MDWCRYVANRSGRESGGSREGKRWGTGGRGKANISEKEGVACERDQPWLL
jgi:hypothetical protein